MKKLLFIIALSLAAPNINAQNRRATATPAANRIALDAPVPDGFVVVATGQTAKTIKRPGVREIVCADSPVPNGYHVVGLQPAKACLNSGNPLNNGMLIERDGAPPEDANVLKPGSTETKDAVFPSDVNGGYWRRRVYPADRISVDAPMPFYVMRRTVYYEGKEFAHSFYLTTDRPTDGYIIIITKAPPNFPLSVDRAAEWLEMFAVYSGGAMAKDRKLTVFGRPAHDMEIELPDNHWLRFRFFAVGNVGYTLAFGTDVKNLLHSTCANRFFDSFKLNESR